MAAGYVSLIGRWVFRLAASTTSPEPILCPCPEYGVDPTLYNQFNSESSLSNQFLKDGTLSNQFNRDVTLLNEFGNIQTLTNQWGKRNCNG